MKFIIFIALLLTGCSSLPKKTGYSKGQCFVKWSSEEYKTLYHKGKTMSRDEKSDQNLLFPLWQNQGIYIIDKVNDNLIVAFDPSDKTPFVIIERIKNDFFHELSPQTEVELRTSKFKFTSDQLQSLLIGYDEVECSSYMDSQFL